MTDQAPAAGLRTLGAPVAKRPAAATKDAPKRNKAQTALAEQAVKSLRAEFKRALALKKKLSDEAAVGGAEKGRGANESEKIRSIIASLEGMSRFALSMALVTPAESRALWAEAMKKGLYEGWR